MISYKGHQFSWSDVVIQASRFPSMSLEDMLGVFIQDPFATFINTPHMWGSVGVSVIHPNAPIIEVGDAGFVDVSYTDFSRVHPEFISHWGDLEAKAPITRWLRDRGWTLDPFPGTEFGVSDGGKVIPISRCSLNEFPNLLVRSLVVESSEDTTSSKILEGACSAVSGYLLNRPSLRPVGHPGNSDDYRDAVEMVELVNRSIDVFYQALAEHSTG